MIIFRAAKKQKRAFTLVEILIALLITGVLMSALKTVFFSIFESYTYNQDISEAKQRGQIALAAISPYISGAALGIPTDTAKFQTAFTSGGTGVTETAKVLFPANLDQWFTGPVLLASNDIVLPGNVNSDDLAGPELWLVYALPSGIGVEKDFTVGDTPKAVTLTAEPPAQHFEVESDTLKSWVVFPGTNGPLFINSKIDAKEYNLAARTSGEIWAFDEMHYVRGVKIKVDEGNLKVMRLDGDPGSLSWQPVVEGIAAIDFRFSKNRVLQVTVLARGTEEHLKVYSDTIAGWSGPLPADLHYRYAAETRSWRIRN